MNNLIVLLALFLSSMQAQGRTDVSLAGTLYASKHEVSVCGLNDDISSPLVGFYLQKTDSIAQSDSAKTVQYANEKKSSTAAVIFSLLCTSTGHAYAGNWGRGLLFAAGEVGCIALIFGGAAGSRGDKETISPLVPIGALALCAVRVWEIIDAAAEVNRYNEALYTRILGKRAYELNFLPNKSGLQLQLSYSF